MTATLTRQTFQTSRLLEYFSKKELTLQTGHEPERWPDVVLKELLDNALDACEEANVLPEIVITGGRDSLTVEDNGPGLPAKVIKGVLNYSVRTSSKDCYISPSRGAQGNALKTVLAIPYVLSGCVRGDLTITSRGQQHGIQVTVDEIAQQPVIRDDVSPDGAVKTGTRLLMRWPDSACSQLETAAPRFLQMVETYSLFNPHATFRVRIGATQADFPRTAQACAKWVTSEPTSPHWYTAEQLRALACAYLNAERQGARPRTVREFIAEFRRLSGTAKQSHPGGLAGRPRASPRPRGERRRRPRDAGHVTRSHAARVAGGQADRLRRGGRGDDHRVARAPAGRGHVGHLHQDRRHG